jgi:hypothetical protein
MQALIVLLVLYLIVVLLILPIWTFIKIGGQRDDHDELKRQLGYLEDEVKNLRAALRNLPATPAKTETPPVPVPVKPAAALAAPPPPVVTATMSPPEPAPAETEPISPLPLNLGGLPVFTESAHASSIPPPALSADLSAIALAKADAEPPPLPPVIAPVRPVYTPPPPAPGWMDSFNWEQFMGAKLFAWLGGLALFLGVAFFVKYSFEHELIPPAVRAALGFLLGAGLIVGGLKILRVKYAITSQTLIASGVVSLYAVTFACRSIYHFEFFGPVPTFLLMTLITAMAFILAVRLEAQVVAILGILGGFLTPVLLTTGVDNPVGLFGYLALLDIGLVAVALHRSWFYLVPLGATGTVVMMVGWADKFYAPEKTVTAMTVCLGFSALFLGATEAARWWKRTSPLLGQTAIALPVVAAGFAWHFLEFPEVASQTGLFFTFVFLVSLIVFALAWREEMDALVAGVAGVTALLMIRWAMSTFKPEQAPVIVTVCLIFCAVYFAAYLLARRWSRTTLPVMWAAVGMPAVALGFALFLMDHNAVGARPGLLFGFILASDAVLLALAWIDERLPRLHLVAGLTVFALLSVWSSRHLTDALLPWALAMYLVFAALHTAFPLVLERKRPAAGPTWWSQLFPPLSLLLMLLPVFKLETVSFLLWPAILLVDLIAIGLAVLSFSLAAVAAVLVLTLVATGLCIFKVPVAVVFAPSLLFVIGGFAVFFFAASLWLVRKLGDRLPAVDQQLTVVFGDARAQLPAFSSLLPFLLLIMVCARLTVPDPSAVFGLGLLLVVLTLGLTRLLVIEWLPACALAGMAALEYVWHARHFDPAAAGLPLVWYVTFYVVFAVYPFLFRREFARLTGPWTVAALSGVAHFWMIYQTVKAAWPNDFLGGVPALFVLAPLGSLVAILRTVSADNPKRLNHLAWFGGVALFFITLIFPIQFERQWLTMAWALEGAALLWLFHRVPHPGLRATGAVLLVTAFVRLALNPAVLGYHVRGDTGIFNWYLYAYGLAVAALFMGARLLAPPREQVLGINTPPLLNTLGVILAFLLLNIEIADFFTTPGARSLAFQFSGNFARDMSYTIGWALFALGLLSAGIWQQTRTARYAAIALLSVALLKLFFHDLARLEALYRIGALFAVAVIAILASFAYQRFLPSNEKSPPPQS